MPETTNLSIRMDRELKNEAEQIFSALGMNLTTAITIFIRQAVREKKIPFEIALYPDSERRIITMSDAIAATARIRQSAEQNGTDKLTLDEINAEITAARKERKARRSEGNP